MRVLTWNLFHGRATVPAGRDLLAEFTAALVSWDWDVALLQEVPPWWPAHLAIACQAQARTALTSRNLLAPVRRRLAERHPDLMRSSGGGANAILVRGAAIEDHRRRLLRVWPERRVCHAVALAGDGPWIANLHAQVRPHARARADIAHAAAATLRWADGRLALLGGDFNVRDPAADGFERLGGDGVDHVLGHGLRAGASIELPDRGTLSDHRPVIVTVLPRELHGSY